jgi:hypothetical protein
VCVEATSLSSKTSLSTHRLAATTTRLLNIPLWERAQTTVYDLRPNPRHFLQPFPSSNCTMALLSLQRGLSLLLAAWVACVYAQDAASSSDVKSIPLRTHSLSQVSLLVFADTPQQTR